jgi:hypothetical protein
MNDRTVHTKKIVQTLRENCSQDVNSYERYVGRNLIASYMFFSVGGEQGTDSDRNPNFNEQRPLSDSVVAI